MFYISNTSNKHTPYRVERIDQDKKDDQQSNQKFNQKFNAKKQDKYLKANEMLYKKREVIVAKEIMSQKIITLKEDLTLDEAWRLIQRHKIEYFPIINNEGKLVGLLSEKDILRKIQEKQGDKNLKEFIGKHTLCADTKTALSDLIEVFFKEKIEAIPILDNEHNLVGMLSQGDLLSTIFKISHLKP